MSAVLLLVLFEGCFERTPKGKPPIWGVLFGGKVCGSLCRALSGVAMRGFCGELQSRRRFGLLLVQSAPQACFQFTEQLNKKPRIEKGIPS